MAVSPAELCLMQVAAKIWFEPRLPSFCIAANVSCKGRLSYLSCIRNATSRRPQTVIRKAVSTRPNAMELKAIKLNRLSPPEKAYTFLYEVVMRTGRDRSLPRAFCSTTIFATPTVIATLTIIV